METFHLTCVILLCVCIRTIVWKSNYQIRSDIFLNRKKCLKFSAGKYITQSSIIKIFLHFLSSREAWSVAWGTDTGNSREDWRNGAWIGWIRACFRGFLIFFYQDLYHVTIVSPTFATNYVRIMFLTYQCYSVRY
jgi:hypothetical protein